MLCSTRIVPGCLMGLNWKRPLRRLTVDSHARTSERLKMHLNCIEENFSLASPYAKRTILKVGWCSRLNVYAERSSRDFNGLSTRRGITEHLLRVSIMHVAC